MWGINRAPLFLLFFLLYYYIEIKYIIATKTVGRVGREVKVCRGFASEMILCVCLSVCVHNHLLLMAKYILHFDAPPPVPFLVNIRGASMTKNGIKSVKKNI